MEATGTLAQTSAPSTSIPQAVSADVCRDAVTSGLSRSDTHGLLEVIIHLQQMVEMHRSELPEPELVAEMLHRIRIEIDQPDPSPELLRSLIAHLYMLIRDVPPLDMAGHELERTLEGALTAAHIADAHLVLPLDAANTATMMQNVGPLLTALQPTKDAVVRIGAVLVVKVDWQVHVLQLTAAQQAALDHRPQLATSPRDVISAIGLLSAPSAPTAADSNARTAADR